MNRPEFQVFGSDVTGWRWRLVGANGENMGPSSEAYSRKADAIRGARDHARAAGEARIVTFDKAGRKRPLPDDPVLV